METNFSVTFAFFFFKSSAQQQGLTWSNGPVSPVTLTLAWLMVEVLIIPAHTVKELHVAGKNICRHLAAGYGMRTGCPLHRCSTMAAEFLPLRPPDSSSALQTQSSSASRAMLHAGNTESSTRTNGNNTSQHRVQNLVKQKQSGSIFHFDWFLGAKYILLVASYF